MIDLSVKVETCLNDRDYIYMAHRLNLDLEKDFPLNLKADYKDRNKDKFNLLSTKAKQLLANEEMIEYAFNSAVHHLYRNGYVYVEFAFDATSFVTKELSLRKVINSALRGLNEGLRLVPKFDANIVLVTNYDCDKKNINDLYNLVKEFQNERIVAFAFEGDSKNKINKYDYVLKPSVEDNIPVVLFLNKYHDINDIKDALKYNVKRIYGAYKLLDDGNLVRSLQLKGDLYFAFQPSKDYLCAELDKYEDLPIRNFVYNSVRTYIDASQYFISSTCEKMEFTHLMRHLYQYTREDIYQSLYFASNTAFVNLSSKLNIQKRLILGFDKFYNDII